MSMACLWSRVPSPVLHFLADQRGGGTMMGLFWFVLMVGIAGVAVDATDGFRNRTMLQATADSAALAAAIDLPLETAVKRTAVDYAERNMKPDLYGHTLRRADVAVGTWDHESRRFLTGAVVPDAVSVRLSQTEKNGNAIAVQFLRIVGVESWEVNVAAVAQRFIPDCLRNGLIARGLVDMSSNNRFSREICVHGQRGVHVQSNNTFDPGVTVSMLDMETLKLPASGYDSNSGLRQALRENGLDPRMVNHVGGHMDDLLAKEAYILPAYVDPEHPIEGKGWNWKFDDVQPGRIYHVQCDANKNVSIPANAELRDVAIVADCNLHVGSHAELVNVVLASRAGGNNGGNGGGGSGQEKNNGNGGPGVENANITFAADVVLGAADDCTEGGGVQIFSDASVKFSSSMTLNGVQVVAAGDVDLGARDLGINGISVQAGGDITLTSNNMFGLCQGGTPELYTSWYYRLVL